MPVIRAATEVDLPAILAIFNHAIIHSTAVWIDEPVDLPNRQAWFAARQAAGFPVLVALAQAALADTDDGASQSPEVLGFASFGDFRAFPGYRHTVEHSIYMRSDERGAGTGSALLAALEDHARALGKHRMIGGIDGENLGSIRFHERHGYARAGCLTQVGIKFGRWLDLIFMEKAL